MPLEIRELVVKITVEEQNAKRGLSEHELQELKKKIIKECVDKVIVKLENQLQR
ncbi:MAG: hypothetical protein JST26_08680 [Bacteroidetes bacterium]|nr:hypothetical protein [Bacteroidota bacterium]